MANGARSPPWTPPGSGELSREGSLAFSSGLPHPHSTAPRRAEAYFSILKEWRRTQALRQRPALPVTPPATRALTRVRVTRANGGTNYPGRLLRTADSQSSGLHHDYAPGQVFERASIQQAS